MISSCFPVTIRTIGQEDKARHILFGESAIEWSPRKKVKHKELKGASDLPFMEDLEKKEEIKPQVLSPSVLCRKRVSGKNWLEYEVTEEEMIRSRNTDRPKICSSCFRAYFQMKDSAGAAAKITGD